MVIGWSGEVCGRTVTWSMEEGANDDCVKPSPRVKEGNHCDSPGMDVRQWTDLLRIHVLSDRRAMVSVKQANADGLFYAS